MQDKVTTQPGSLGKVHYIETLSTILDLLDWESLSHTTNQYLLTFTPESSATLERHVVFPNGLQGSPDRLLSLD